MRDKNSAVVPRYIAREVRAALRLRLSQQSLLIAA